jgi:hypothetical protein
MTADAVRINPDDGPLMLGLGGGTVLLRGPAVVHVSRALDWAISVQARRDSVHASKPLRQLQQLLADEAAQVSGGHVADVRKTAVVPISPENMINTEEAAAMLRRSPRQIRRLAADLEGRQIAGRWLFDRDVVAAAAAERGITP